MAKVIFSKDDPNSVYKIARDDDFLNANKNFDTTAYELIDIPADDFTQIKLSNKLVLYHDGADVYFAESNHLNDPQANQGQMPPEEPNGVPFVWYSGDGDELQVYINNLDAMFENYLKGNADKPLGSLVATYKAYLKTINLNDVIALNVSLEQYVNDQGQEPIHPLELI